MPYLYFFLTVSYFNYICLGMKIFLIISGVISIMIFILSFLHANRYFKISSSVFMFVGLIFMVKDNNYQTFLLSITHMVPMIILLSLLPFITSFFLIGKFEKELRSLVRHNTNHLRSYYRKIFIATFIMAFFLSFAAIPIVANIIKKDLYMMNDETKNSLITKAILPGFCIGQLCSPMELLIVLTVEITGIKYINLLPYLVVLASLMISYVFITSQRMPTSTVFTTCQRQVISFKRVMTVILFLVGFLMSIIMIEGLFQVRFLLVLITLIIPYTALWAMIIKRFKAFLKHGFLSWKAKTEQLYNFAVLFIPLGFFIYQFQNSTVYNDFSNNIVSVQENSTIIFMFLPIVFIALTLIGVHPILLVGALGSSLLSILDTFNAISLAIVMIASAMSTMAIGPFNITVLMIKDIVNESTVKIIKRNITFALAMGIIGTTMAYILSRF